MIDNKSQFISGIRVQSASAGIKQAGKKDMVLFELAEGTRTAAVFTQNKFCAAPVIIARDHLLKNSPRYLLINSGNANAGTGETGFRDALACCAEVAKVCGCDAEQVLPFSTGVIGEDMPIEKLLATIDELQNNLTDDAWQLAAEAIMTTDTKPKLVSTQVSLAGKVVNITGIAKGAGMIAPNMATMLAYVATDADVESSVLQDCLKSAADISFNRIVVDGDTSTNDSLVLMATGKSSIVVDDSLLEQFQAALNEVCVSLARAIVQDGEGATKLINVTVKGGDSEKDCLTIANSIALSPLVKTAFFASDPNWGRILAAIGYADVDSLNVDTVDIYLDDVCIVKNGARDPNYTEQAGEKVMQQPEINLSVNLNQGDAQVIVWTCDLSYDYVRINAEYRT